MSENATTLIKIGAIILLVQNIILIVGTQAGETLLSIVLYIDLLGFGILGLGFILQASSEPEKANQLYIGGGGMLGWVAMRIWWQFILLNGLGDLLGGDLDADAFDSIEDTLKKMLLAFLLSGIFLAVSFFFLYKAGKVGTLMLSYGIVNLIGVYMIYTLTLSFFLGLILKFFVVPILGIIGFLKMSQAY